jgi:Kef-type K+ transport system membrane component KefB
MSVSAGALWANLGILALLFAGKMVPKLAGVYPLARRYTAPHAVFTTLLMSTGLTFGTISSLYGLNAGIIDRTQFSLLIAVVVLSAIVPTAIAQRFFQPHAEHERQRDRGEVAAPMPPAPEGVRS